MSQFFAAAPRIWLGAFITMEIAAAYGCLTAIALTRHLAAPPRRAS